MIDLVFAAPRLIDLRSDLFHEHLESAAILLASPVVSDSRTRLVVQEINVAGDGDYEVRNEYEVRLRPEFGLPIEKKAKLNNWSLIYCHTHPRQVGWPEFSPIDNDSEIALADYARRRSPSCPHVSLLFGKERLAARELGTRSLVRVLEIGENRAIMYDEDAADSIDTSFDRQVRAFGEDGQKKLRALSVAIVGLGGTGSVIAQQLAYLGVNSYVLIDPDIVDVTSLNRLVGALPSDVSIPKVKVAERLIKLIRSSANVKVAQADVVAMNVSAQLKSVDFIFCCTDSHASRHLINQFAYQYVVPVIDVGVAIHRAENGNVQIAGRTTMLSPGLPCLWCAEQLDPAAVRRELMNEEQRRADPYFSGSDGVPQPSVISLNSTLASLAVTMFLSAVTGIPANGRFLIYDANRGRVSRLSAPRKLQCNFCSDESTANGADAFPLPERRYV